MRTLLLLPLVCSYSLQWELCYFSPWSVLTAYNRNSVTTSLGLFLQPTMGTLLLLHLVCSYSLHWELCYYSPWSVLTAFNGNSVTTPLVFSYSLHWELCYYSPWSALTAYNGNSVTTPLGLFLQPTMGTMLLLPLVCSYSLQ